MASKYANMTKEMAFDLCEKLWAKLAENGSKKKKTVLSEITKSDRIFAHNCPICEYVRQQHDIYPDSVNCRKYCPFVQASGHNCYALGYREWESTDWSNTNQLKKHALKFYNNILPIIKNKSE